MPAPRQWSGRHRNRVKALGCHPRRCGLNHPAVRFRYHAAILRLGAEPVFVDTDGFRVDRLTPLPPVCSNRAGISDSSSPCISTDHCLICRNCAACAMIFRSGSWKIALSPSAHVLKVRLGGYAADFAAVSFYPTKNLGAIGDGGALLTNDATLDRAARALRDYGQKRQVSARPGRLQQPLDELQAAFMHRGPLPRLDAWTLRRRRIAERYCAEISHPDVRVPGRSAGSESVWHLFPVLVRIHWGLAGRRFGARGEAILYGPSSRGVGLWRENIIDPDPGSGGSHWSPRQNSPLPGQPRCKISAAEVSLPIHPYLSNQDVDQVIGAVNRWSRGNVSTTLDSAPPHALN